MKPAFILVIASLATTITAQGLTGCSVNCLITESENIGCNDFTQVECICSDTGARDGFRDSVVQCVETSCSSGEVQGAVGEIRRVCPGEA